MRERPKKLKPRRPAMGQRVANPARKRRSNGDRGKEVAEAHDGYEEDISEEEGKVLTTGEIDPTMEDGGE